MQNEERCQIEPIKTNRLILIPLRFADAEALFTIAQNPESIEDFQQAAQNLEEVEAWVKQSLDASTLSWTVRLDGKIIGLVEADIKKGSVADVGYFIAAEHQRKGYATEALGAVIDWLLSSMKIHRVEAGVTTKNIASRRVVEKLGFLLEGVSRKNWLWDDEWYDSANYALLREEWHDESSDTDGNGAP